MATESYAYNGKARKPGVSVTIDSYVLKHNRDYTLSYSSNKNPGRGKVTIKGKGGFGGTAYAHFNILPKRSKITKLQSLSSARLRVQWSKDTSVSRHEVEVCLSPDFEFGNDEVMRFAAGKSSTTITKTGFERGNTYYVRVRGAKSAGGEMYYGAWSPAKQVTVK